MRTTDTKKRTITLTGRAPVKIIEAQWPIIAEASGDSYRGNDCGKHQQATHHGEVDVYTLKVRQHADGRTLVYGILDAAIAAWNAPAGGESFSGGELLYKGADIASAIECVGIACGLPASLIRECIASLPAVELE